MSAWDTWEKEQLIEQQKRIDNNIIRDFNEAQQHMCENCKIKRAVTKMSGNRVIGCRASLYYYSAYLCEDCKKEFLATCGDGI